MSKIEGGVEDIRSRGECIVCEECDGGKKERLELGTRRRVYNPDDGGGRGGEGEDADADDWSTAADEDENSSSGWRRSTCSEAAASRKASFAWRAWSMGTYRTLRRWMGSDGQSWFARRSSARGIPYLRATPASESLGIT